MQLSDSVIDALILFGGCALAVGIILFFALGLDDKDAWGNDPPDDFDGHD